MDLKQECKLCGNIIREENYKVIEDATKSIFDFLSLKLSLDNDSVICATCSSKLLAALNFKSACLYTDNSIIPYIDYENRKLVDLKDVYAKEIGNMQGSILLDDREICRLCLKPMSSDHKSIEEVPLDSIQIYIPEINFEVSTNPAICLNCYDALRVHSSFIRNCLDAEKKINRDAADVGDMLSTNPCIKMEEIEIKSEETDDTLSKDLCDLKKEENEEGDASLHLPKGEETKSLYNVDDLKQTSAPLTVASDDSKECVYKTMGDNNTRKSTCLTVEEYQCQTCMFNTRNRTSFMKHQLIHKDPSEVQMHQCDKCKFMTKYRYNLIQHYLQHKDPSEVQMFKCDECDYKSIRRSDIRKHQLRHKDPSEVQVFKCDECDFKSIHKGNLVKHRLTHKDTSEMQMFECDECDYKTIRKGDLKQHQLRHKNPSEVRMFKCSECDYKNVQKGNVLKHHLRHKKPSQAQMYKCYKCKFITKNKDSLIQHYLEHKYPSEARMFECCECDYKSIRKGDIKKHQLKHKGPFVVQMFKCSECDYESMEKGNLLKHQLRHKDPSEVQMYKCDKCKFVTKHKCSLRLHQLKHKDPAEVRMFECHECDYKNVQKGNLLRHQLKHKNPPQTQISSSIGPKYTSI